MRLGEQAEQQLPVGGLDGCGAFERCHGAGGRGRSAGREGSPLPSPRLLPVDRTRRTGWGSSVARGILPATGVINKIARRRGSNRPPPRPGRPHRTPHLCLATDKKCTRQAATHGVSLTQGNSVTFCCEFCNCPGIFARQRVRRFRFSAVRALACHRSSRRRAPAPSSKAHPPPVATILSQTLQSCSDSLRARGVDPLRQGTLTRQRVAATRSRVP